MAASDSVSAGETEIVFLVRVVAAVLRRAGTAAAEEDTASSVSDDRFLFILSLESYGD